MLRSLFITTLLCVSSLCPAQGRVGSPVIQNLTQNLVHKGFGKAPFYLNYEYIRRGPYAYSGFDSPISIFNF
jgi:hypothetical protein